MSEDINSIIDQLAEIDSASAKIMQKTQIEKSKFAELITQQKKDFDNSLQKEVDKAVLEYKNYVDTENQNLIEQYRIDCEHDIEKLDKMFKDNGNNWADEIFKNIVKE